MSDDEPVRLMPIAFPFKSAALWMPGATSKMYV